MKLLIFLFCFSLNAFDFPKDHTFHKYYKVEWVYFVGHLKSNSREFGYELSFFKGLIEDKIEIFPVHFAISDFTNKKYYNAQTLQRNLGLAEYSEKIIRSGDYKLEILNASSFKIIAKPRNSNISLELNLDSSIKEILLHGEKGHSIKSRKNPELFSNYYSIPKLNSKGNLKLENENFLIESGISWMDHEWSSEIREKKNSKLNLSSSEVSWDWVCINFEDDSSLMVFNFRESNNSLNESFGTFKSKDKVIYFNQEKEIQFLKHNTVWKSPKSLKSYPLKWTIEFLDKKVEIEAIFPEQEFIATSTTGNIYWEGGVKAQVTSTDGKKILGKGYLEMKGY